MKNYACRSRACGHEPHKCLNTLANQGVIRGDSLEKMKDITDNSIDLILTDPPYGITQNSWDYAFAIDEYFKEFWRVLKDTGVVVMTSKQPFASQIITLQGKNFKYELIWDKIRPSGFLNARRQPLPSHENILVFYKKQPTYNPQFSEGKPTHSRGKMGQATSKNYGEYKNTPTVEPTKKYPKSVLTFIKPHPAVHPTQKPVELFEWLINTYSNEWDVVLDPFLGSGTTVIAAKNLNRHVIGIEKDEEYYEIARKRLEQEQLF